MTNPFEDDAYARIVHRMTREIDERITRRVAPVVDTSIHFSGDRYGDWIQTFSGKRFYILDPRVEDVDIIDIAHSLSLLCRFNGHCSRFYSVGEHSILIAACIEQEGGSPQECLEGLMHDSPEAYVADVPRPLKRSPEMLPYREAEERVERVVFAKFGLRWPLSPFIKLHDQR